MQIPNVWGAVLEQVIYSVDVVYPRLLHQQMADTFLYNIGSWNDIRIIAHLDDIELMDDQTVRMILYLARSG